ncbi:hypothetical protein KIL84_009935 [Mauremys mutica]|uniref:Uncharacterized protein n=1 Tax=Mauremys mutica TaxID=74926 RepID=A0A9D3XMH5_9SAUR|nr:hypothetical protein KIL84_009935 [Mauremys mutica]
MLVGNCAKGTQQSSGLGATRGGNAPLPLPRGPKGRVGETKRGSSGLSEKGCGVLLDSMGHSCLEAAPLETVHGKGTQAGMKQLVGEGKAAAWVMVVTGMMWPFVGCWKAKQ